MPCNIHSHIGGSSANSTGYESMANWHISANLIHHLIRWWDRLTRFTIPGMMSRILIKIWQSANRMYSRLISFRSNQRFPASFVLDLRTRPDRNFREAVSLSGSAFVDNLCLFSLINVVPQSPPEYEPFNFPLAHLICLLYSESLRVFTLLLTLRQSQITQIATSLF